MDVVPEIEGALAGAYPWLSEELARTRRGVFAQRWRLPATPEALWPVLSDTSRLNRLLGVPRATFDEQQGRRHGESRYFRRVFRWAEPPWEWIRDELIVCRKLFHTGPVTEVLAVLHLQADGPEHTVLTVWYGWVGRGLTGPIAVPQLSRYLERGYLRVIPQLQAWAQQGCPEHASPLIRGRDHADPTAVAAARGAMQAAHGELYASLVDHLVRGDAMELHRLQPGELAERWRRSVDEVLSLLFDATSQGLLLARWDVTCPHCRGTRASLASLDAVVTHHRCEACDVGFETTSDRLELTFRVHPAVRAIEPRQYCAAEAAQKPHVVAQLVTTSPRSIALELPPGTYRLRKSDGSEPRDLEVGEEPVSMDLSASPLPWVVETVAPERVPVRPRDVLSRADYRAVMGTEALAADLALEMGAQTLLFTDVVASTDFYRERGDAGAFRVIREHFAVIFGHVKSEGGVVIKTIGDAVMAAFPTPESGARAAKRIATAPLGEVSVRLSLHAGPCIAVNMDTGVDYFGAVVNEAAKLQAAAGPGEVAVSPALAERLSLEGRSRSYTSGSREHEAVVWVPRPDEATPAPARRRG